MERWFNWQNALIELRVQIPFFPFIFTHNLMETIGSPKKKGTKMSITMMVYGFVFLSVAIVTGIEYYISITYDDEY